MPAPSNTEALAKVVIEALEGHGVQTELLRVAGYDVRPGVSSDEGDGDQERPVAYNRVAGVVVTGNEDGAHHVINELNGALIDIGFTVPGQAWTYWNMGPGPGPSYTETDQGHDWSASTGRAAAGNLVAVARALAASPMPAPAS